MNQTRSFGTTTTKQNYSFQDKLDEGDRLHATLWKIVYQEQQERQNQKINGKINVLLRKYHQQIILLMENLEILNDSQLLAGEQLRANAVVKKLSSENQLGNNRKCYNVEDLERVTGLIKENISSRTNVDFKSIIEFDCVSVGTKAASELLLQQLKEHSQPILLINHHHSAELKNRIIQLIEKIQQISLSTNDQLDKLCAESICLFSDYFNFLRKFGLNNGNGNDEDDELADNLNDLSI